MSNYERIVNDVQTMIADLLRVSVYGPYEIHIPIHRVAHMTTFLDGMEFWDFSSDDFILEAWERMAFGSVHVRT